MSGGTSTGPGRVVAGRGFPDDCCAGGSGSLETMLTIGVTDVTSGSGFGSGRGCGTSHGNKGFGFAGFPPPLPGVSSGLVIFSLPANHQLSL